MQEWEGGGIEGPFPAAQTAGMFPGFWLLTVNGAEE